MPITIRPSAAIPAVPTNGAELRAWRDRMGWPIVHASKRLGISPRCYAYLEAGWRDGQALELPRPVALATVSLEQFGDHV